MIKKSVFAFLAVCICTVCTGIVSGCNNRDSDNKVSINSTDDLDENQTYFNENIHIMAKADNGYYYVHATEQHIYYYDNEQQESVVLCGKAECTHTDENCMSYFSLHDYVDCIYYYRDYIYLIRYDDGNAILQRVERDGSAREDVAVLGAYGDDSSVSVVFCNGNAYVRFGNSVISEEKLTFSILEVSLETGKTRTVYEYTDVNTRIMKMKAYGNRVYFIIRKLEEIDSKPFLRGLGLYAYDTAKEESFKVLDGDILDYCIDTENKNIYYFVQAEGLYSYNTENSQSEKLVNATEETAMCELSFDGNNIYMDNDLWSFYSKRHMKSDKKIDRKVWVFDKDGNMLQTFSLENVVNLIYGDSQKLFAYMAFPDRIPGFYYLDKAELLQGKKEWIPLNKE